METQQRTASLPHQRRREEREWEQPTSTDREMPCPVCGHPMPDLKGGKATICPICGFKDSCCY